MSRQAITAAAFALTAGLPSDARALLHVDPDPRLAGGSVGGRRVLVGVEPLEPSARGFELAALALSVLRQSMAATADRPPAVALTRAFAAANAALLAENRPLAGSRWERRVYVGATAAVVTGRTLTIAQVPATQALVVQDRRLYAFPDLASWCPTYLPPTDRPEPDPLGCRDETRPWLYHTVAAPGDLVLLCSSAVARHLARDAANGTSPNPELLLRNGNLDAALERLGEIVVAHELDDAFAAGVVVDRVPSVVGGIVGGAVRDGIGRLGAAWPGWTPGRQPGRAHPAAPVAGRSYAGSGGAAVLAVASLGGGDAPGNGRAGGAATPPPAIPRGGAAASRPTPARDIAVELLPAAAPRRRAGEWEAEETGFGVRLRRGLAALSGRVAPSRRPRPATAAARRAPITPGATSVRRYTERSAAPPEWRTNLPRGPEVHVPGRLLTVVVLLFLTFGGTGVALEQRRERTARLDAALSRVDGQLRAASAAAAGRAPAALVRADSALAEARAAGAPAETLAARRYAIDNALDRALGCGRLSDVTRLGALPAALAAAPVRLVRADREVYLVGEGLYRLVPDERRLVRLLSPGDEVDGATVGGLRLAGADDRGVTVGDGAALYARAADGRWTRRPVAAVDSDAPIVPTAAYRGNVYALGPDGGVVKYPGDAGADGAEIAPLTWTDAADNPDLADARDLVVDGRVHILLADGRVLSFFQGEPETTWVPTLSPPLTAPIALDGGAEAGVLFLADAGVVTGSTAGRLVRLGADGSAWQILPPSPTADPASVAAARALARARDLVVDEAAGVVYFVTDRDLWRAALPPAPGSATIA